MPTSPKSCCLASVTKTFPGPKILSARGIVSVPSASAAIACAPEARKTRCTPASSAATSFSGCTLPSSRAAVTPIRSGTPATSAGSAVCSTEEGSTATLPVM